MPDPSETLPAASVGRAKVPVLAALVAGPTSGRDLAARLRCRWSTVSLALRGLEAEGRVARSQRTGRGTCSALVEADPEDAVIVALEVLADGWAHLGDPA